MFTVPYIRRFVPVFLLIVLAASPALADTAPMTLPAVRSMVASQNYPGLKAFGPGVLPLLVDMYKSSDASERERIANAFYALGWKSAEAKQVLMQDAHTANPSLRIVVQYALGHVSDDRDVVDVLLDNMMNDANPLLRDKAACALAYDQIHLSEQQKIRLYQGLITALSDSKLDVRAIAIQALSIQTGQTKGFDPNGMALRRWMAVRDWNKWLDDYRSHW